jgi:hypothetical protein
LRRRATQGESILLFRVLRVFRSRALRQRLGPRSTASCSPPRTPGACPSGHVRATRSILPRTCFPYSHGAVYVRSTIPSVLRSACRISLLRMTSRHTTTFACLLCLGTARPPEPRSATPLLVNLIATQAGVSSKSLRVFSALAVRKILALKFSRHIQSCSPIHSVTRMGAIPDPNNMAGSSVPRRMGFLGSPA